MQQSPPLVSVLMTVFNAEAYLEASIKSICAQTFSDWEFLIVDDASTDSSLAIAEAYALQDKRIRVIKNRTNKGQTACLNQGLSEARGMWIARQDADDLSLPLRLEQQMKHGMSNPRMALIGACGFMIDDHDRLVGLLDVPLRDEVISWSLPLMNPFLHTAVLFRTEVVRFLGGYDTTYRIAQDYDLWSRVIGAGYTTKNLSERLICYRHLNSSLSKANQERTLEEIGVISKRSAEEIFREGLSEKEQLLLQAWRSPQERGSFWKFYQKISSLLPQENILIQKDHARFTAVLHLQLAGSSSSYWALLQEMGVAFMSDSSFVLGWLFTRFFSFLTTKNF